METGMTNNRQRFYNTLIVIGIVGCVFLYVLCTNPEKTTTITITGTITNSSIDHFRETCMFSIKTDDGFTKTVYDDTRKSPYSTIRRGDYVSFEVEETRKGYKIIRHTQL